MHIVQILPALKEGGVETGTIDLCLYLKKQGHTVTVISNGGPLVQKLKDEGITHLSWPVHKKNPWTIYQLSRKLIRFIQNNSIELIHARSRVPGWITYLACRKTKTKWVTTCHGYYQKHLGSRVMSWADKIIVATDVIKNHMVTDFKVDPSKIAFIPRGVDLEKFTFSPPPLPKIPILGMIGRITPIKGHKDFLEALALLKKTSYSFKAHIIGEASNPHYLQELKILIHQLGLSDVVTFLGHQEDIPSILQGLSLLVMPSTYPESFGRSIIEAQAMGVPVVATGIGGIQEIIEHEKTGLLCLPNNPKDLAQNIIEILNNPQKTQKMILEARKKVETTFSKDQMVQKTEHLYQTLLSPRILVIKLSSLGDTILISPSLRALRKKFPLSQITLLTNSTSQDVFKFCPYIDDMLFFSTKIIPLLRKKKFDLSIDFQNNTGSHLTSFLSSIPHRYGYGRKWGKYLLTHIAQNHSLPPVEHQFEILKLLGIPLTNSKLEFWINEQDRESSLKWCDYIHFNSQKPFCIIHIGASWETKRWKASHIADFCYLLQTTKNLQILLTGTQKDIAFEKEILSYAKYHLYSLVGQTSLRELGALIQRCHLFICADSAPLHMAAAFAKPTLALFGPTDPNRHRPPSSKLLILQEKVDCGPCYKPTCNHHSCMVNLKPNRAIEAYKNLL